jgi:drug/metabolite transporter (DMT)-like permease
VGALFGSLSALSIGLSDLFARRLVRASSAVTASVAISMVAIVTSVVAVALFGSSLEPSDLVIGLVSGLGLGVGLASYYAGMTRSSSTVVTPIVAALSAIIPFVYAVATGSDATAYALVGAAVAVGGLMLITIGGGGVHHVRAGLLWGALSGLAYGVGVAVVIEASDDAGAFPAVGQRIAATAVTTTLALRSGQPVLPPVAARRTALIGGTFAGCSTVLYLIGVRADATAAVITTSMFPAASVAIGRTFFGDPVSRLQVVGIAVVLAGVIGVTVG